MFHHCAYAVDGARLRHLLAVHDGGDITQLAHVAEQAREDRRARATTTRIHVTEAEANERAKIAGAAVERMVRLWLTADGRPIEDVQRLRRSTDRFQRLLALNGPEIIIANEGSIVVQILHDALYPPAPPGEPPHPTLWEIVELARAIGAEDIGVGEAFDSLDAARAFTEAFPHAGSFWDIHGTGGPADVVERYPHPVWADHPAALPVRLPHRTDDEGAGPLSLVDADSLDGFAPADPLLAPFAARVREAVAAGHAVVGWLEWAP